MNIVTKTDTEQALAIIREWSLENVTAGDEWRQIHAASNVLALAEFQAAEGLGAAKAKFSEAKQKLTQAEAMASLKHMGDLMAGRAVSPNGEKFPEMSYSAAKEVAKQFVPITPEVTKAQAGLLVAESGLKILEQKLMAMRELSQGGKSTAQQLCAEVRMAGMG